MWTNGTRYFNPLVIDNDIKGLLIKEKNILFILDKLTELRGPYSKFMNKINIGHILQSMIGSGIRIRIVLQHFK